MDKIFCTRFAVHCNFDGHSHDPYILDGPVFFIGAYTMSYA